MLAKVIAHGASRKDARRRLIAALENTVALGLVTNRSFLIAVLRHPAFAAGEATTDFIDRYFAAGSDAMRGAEPDNRTLALAALLLFEARSRATASVSAVARNWSSTGAATWPLRVALGNAHHAISISAMSADDYAVALGREVIEVSIAERGDGFVRFTALGLQQTARFAAGEGTLHLDVAGSVFALRETTLETAGSARRDASSRLLAPMNGAIVSVLGKPGDPVAKGQRVVVLEAMKMQHEIAPARWHNRQNPGQARRSGRHPPAFGRGEAGRKRRGCCAEAAP